MSDESPTIVNLTDVDSQLHDHLTSYLSGRTTIEQLFSRVSPLYEESSSPRAERIALLVGVYSLGEVSLRQLRRELEACNELLLN